MSLDPLLYLPEGSDQGEMAWEEPEDKDRILGAESGAS